MSIPSRFLVVVCLKVSGAWSGTFTNAARNLRGLPLGDVRVEGDAVTFAIKLTGGGIFRGTVWTAVACAAAVQTKPLACHLLAAVATLPPSLAGGR